MKKIHQEMKSVFISLLVIFTVSGINRVSAGALYFKMAASKTTLTVGEEISITVSAWVNDPIAEPDNGLDTWQADLSVDNTGIIEITATGGVADITLLAPDPDPMWSGWDETSVNSPITGEVREVVVIQEEVGAPSYIGVGGYSEIFTFNIKALSLGTATYTILNDGGGLFYGALADGTEYDNDIIPGSVIFDAENSNRTFTVIPEPASFSVFAFAALLAVFKKKQ